MVVDRKRGGETLEAFEIATDAPVLGEAVFRIDSTDLNFLRSIGIDPTRRTRTRKRRSP